MQHQAKADARSRFAVGTLTAMTLCLVFICPQPALPQSSGLWNGGTGSWNDPTQWTCNIPPAFGIQCVPNGPQFNINFQSGSITVTTPILVNVISTGANTSLTVNSASLTANVGIAALSSATLTNGTVTTPNLLGVATLGRRTSTHKFNELGSVGLSSAMV
jgi:hypothetical protein